MPLPAPSVLTGSNITLTAQEADVPIFAGTPTRMWTYNGTFPGPTIRRPTGRLTRVTLRNDLPATAGSLSLHNHGNHSSPENDGQPTSFPVPTGASRAYHYTGQEGGGNERGALQWYHDHRDGVTGRNVWMGLAGLYLIDDPADPASLPSGSFDIPLAIADRSFDANNQIAYEFQSNGVRGDHVLVNGRPQPYLDVADRRYRFRVLNASNIRNYELELSNGEPMIQIGTESGLLPGPVPRQRIFLSPGERADVVVDFAGSLGQNVVLRDQLETGPLGELMQFRVDRHEIDTSGVPASLRPAEDIGLPTVTRTFEFRRIGGRWVINGNPFDPDRVDARPVLGATERWILRNPEGWDHTVHIHDVDQQLISRNGQPPGPEELTKESWYIGGGQELEVKLKFTDHVGRYVFHCHVLEHEDDAMMGQFEVVPAPPSPPLPYQTPLSASRLAVSLVPGFRQTLGSRRCAARGGEIGNHAAPLSTPSCNPPRLLTASRAKQGPASEGSAQLAAVAGDGDTATDDADIAISMAVSDVRDQQTGSDYAPNASGADVTLASRLRITDRSHGPSLAASGTTRDLDFPVEVACLPTADTTRGSDCNVSTSADAVLPGSITENEKMVVQTFQVRVNDSGVNGKPGDADDAPFAQQGVYVP